MSGVNEKDWKLFKSRIGCWQEAYMGKLCKEYVALLNGDGKASKKFWELEKRINEDKKSPGVILDMRRSQMDLNIMSLLRDGVIDMDDLEGFSSEFREKMEKFTQE